MDYVNNIVKNMSLDELCGQEMPIEKMEDYQC